MPTVHFVCYGNICRSPYAEHYARRQAQSLGLAGWRFCSSGVGATAGTGTPKPGLRAAAERGVSLEAHRARRVAEVPPEPGDLVIAMDRYVFGELADHLGASLAEVRGPSGSTLSLLMQEIPGADPRALDIPDPMGQGVSAYQQSYGIISEAVDRLVARLIAASSD
jgi:protein-tyrosine phosphatase